MGNGVGAVLDPLSFHLAKTSVPSINISPQAIATFLHLFALLLPSPINHLTFYPI